MTQIPEEYVASDFGFSAVDEETFLKESTLATQTQETLQGKLSQVEKLIMPLLANLLETADKEYIKWPNRGPAVQDTIDKLLAITRE